MCGRCMLSEGNSIASEESYSAYTDQDSMKKFDFLLISTRQSLLENS
jgi:hypothetical protein